MRRARRAPLTLPPCRPAQRPRPTAQASERALSEMQHLFATLCSKSTRPLGSSQHNLTGCAPLSHGHVSWNSDAPHLSLPPAARSVKICAAGTGGGATCPVCPRGTYALAGNATVPYRACTACPAGHTTAGNRTTTASGCSGKHLLDERGLSAQMARTPQVQALINTHA